MSNDVVRKRYLAIGGVIAFILVATYLFIYQFEPFGEFGDTLSLNLVTIASSLVCAIITTWLLSFYETGEPPRLVWLTFAVAAWMWVVAEVTWTVYNMTIGDVPLFSAADIFWTGGYVFFTASLVSQFKLILFDRGNRLDWLGVVAWVIVLGLTYLGILLLNDMSMGAYLNLFYPIADFCIGVAALSLIISFRRGRMARPWLSLLGFVVADTLYFWATSSGVYEWVTRSDTITLVVDTTYVLAYLFLGWGVFNQFLSLKFGSSSTQKTIPQSQLQKS